MTLEQRTKREERRNRYSHELAKFFSERGFEVELERHLTISRGLECALITMVHNPDVRRKDTIGFTIPRFKSTIWRLIKEFRAMRREMTMQLRSNGKQEADLCQA